MSIFYMGRRDYLRRRKNDFSYQETSEFSDFVSPLKEKEPEAGDTRSRIGCWFRIFTQSWPWEKEKQFDPTHSRGQNRPPPPSRPLGAVWTDRGRLAHRRVNVLLWNKDMLNCRNLWGVHLVSRRWLPITNLCKCARGQSWNCFLALKYFRQFGIWCLLKATEQGEIEASTFSNKYIYKWI